MLPIEVGAQVPSSQQIESIRVTPAGWHRLSVRVLDSNDRPVDGIGGAFSVNLDGRPVQELQAVPSSSASPVATVWMVIDGGLLRPPALAGVQDGIRDLARTLRPKDRLHLVVASHRVREREANAEAAAGLARGIETLASDESPTLYDALYQAAREGARLPESQCGVVLVVTRGRDAGSRHKPIEVLAMASRPARRTPIMLVLIGDTGFSTLANRLRLLAQQTGGAATSLGSADGMGPGLSELAQRGLGRWVLRFRAPGWSAAVPTHHLSVSIDRDGTPLVAERDYETSEALPPAWWSEPRIWLGLIVILTIAAIAALSTWRRQRGLLVHHADDQDGVWYELFAFPITVGAATGSDIILVDDQVSRHHAVLERRRSDLELVDLNSENGTFVNGDRVSRRVLHDGDQIDIGPHIHLIYEARG